MTNQEIIDTIDRLSVQRDITLTSVDGVRMYLENRPDAQRLSSGLMHSFQEMDDLIEKLINQLSS